MATFINGWTFNRGTGSVGSWTYPDAIPKVTELGGLGKENPLIRVTSFDSAAGEYIAGLADGSISFSYKISGSIAVTYS